MKNLQKLFSTNNFAKFVWQNNTNPEQNDPINNIIETLEKTLETIKDNLKNARDDNTKQLGLKSDILELKILLSLEEQSSSEELKKLEAELEALETKINEKYGSDESLEDYIEAQEYFEAEVSKINQNLSIEEIREKLKNAEEKFAKKITKQRETKLSLGILEEQYNGLSSWGDELSMKYLTNGELSEEDINRFSQFMVKFSKSMSDHLHLFGKMGIGEKQFSAGIGGQATLLGRSETDNFNLYVKGMLNYWKRKNGGENAEGFIGGGVNYTDGSFSADLSANINTQKGNPVNIPLNLEYKGEKWDFGTQIIFDIMKDYTLIYSIQETLNHEGIKLDVINTGIHNIMIKNKLKTSLVLNAAYNINKNVKVSGQMKTGKNEYFGIGAKINISE